MHSSLAIHLLSRSNAYAHTHIHAKEYSVAGCSAFKNKKRYTKEIEGVVVTHLDRVSWRQVGRRLLNLFIVDII